MNRRLSFSSPGPSFRRSFACAIVFDLLNALLGVPYVPTRRFSILKKSVKSLPARHPNFSRFQAGQQVPYRYPLSEKESGKEALKKPVLYGGLLHFQRPA